MVEVFKTNVETKSSAEKLKEDLSALLPGSEINFDLEDCDKILRVECTTINPASVLNFLVQKGFHCEVLE